MFRKERPEWYTSDVREKRNETWSIEDMLLVYSLRVKKNVPVDEVVEILRSKGKKADKISVYNLTRQSRKALLGKCFRCGEDLSPEELITKKKGRILFLCNKCKKEAHDLKKERREGFLKNGLCGVCGKNPHLPDGTTCRKCLSSVSRRRIAQGLCGTCGMNPIDPRSIHQCSSCLGLNHIRSRLAVIR